jgi:hypothetical protein
MARKFYCPTDQDVILFIEGDQGQGMEMIVAQRPKTCRQCGKSYYKWECVVESENEDVES